MNAPATPAPSAARIVKFERSESQMQDRHSPGRAWAWPHLHASGNALGRVCIPYTGDYPSWNRLPLTEWVGGLAVSRRLRAFYQVQHTACQGMAMKQSFITLNFSEEAARRFAHTNGKLTFAGAAGKEINRLFQQHGIEAEFFLVIEDAGREGRAGGQTNLYAGLHAHILAAHRVGDEEAIRIALNKLKNGNDNSLMIQPTYRQRYRENSNDRIEDFPHVNSKGERYRHALININAADYMAKDFNKPSDHLPTGKGRIYASNRTRAAAKQRYEREHQRIARLNKHRHQLEHLTSGQCLTLAVYGWIARRSSEPDYDWQYEEGEESKVLEKKANSANTLDCAPGPFQKSVQETAQAATGTNPVGMNSDAEFAALMASLDELDIPDAMSPDAGLPTLKETSDRGEMPDDGMGLTTAGASDAPQVAHGASRSDEERSSMPAYRPLPCARPEPFLTALGTLVTLAYLLLNVLKSKFRLTTIPVLNRVPATPPSQLRTRSNAIHTGNHQQAQRHHLAGLHAHTRRVRRPAGRVEGLERRRRRHRQHEHHQEGRPPRIWPCRPSHHTDRRLLHAPATVGLQ